MLKTTRSISLHTACGRVIVAPDLAVVPVTVRVEAPDAARATAAARRLVEQIGQQIAGSGGDLATHRFRSWREKLAGKGLFGHGVRCRAEVLAAATLQLDPAWGYWDRVERVEALYARLQALDDRDEITLGEPSYRLDDPDAHRPAAAARLREQLDASADAMRLQIGRVELEPALAVEILGPDRAALSMTGTVELVA